MTRDRTAAAAGSSLFFALAPGVVAGVIPWAITGWDGAPSWLGWRVLGAVVTAAAAAVLIHAFARFVGEGIGTPVPFARSYPERVTAAAARRSSAPCRMYAAAC